MLRNTSSHGRHPLFSQLRRACVCPYGPRSPHPAVAASPQPLPPHVLALLHNSTTDSSARFLSQSQLRVLRTSTRTPSRPPSISSPPLNWSHSLRRIRHISPSAMTVSHSQTRDHSGHGHHGHGHDNAYLLSSNKNDAGVRITRIGLYVNLGMAVSKGVGGYVFNSQALVADAIHSLTDLVSDIMTLATVSWSLEPPSARFPSGYGKVESLGSLGVSGILLGGGFMMGWAALIALTQQFFPEAAATAANWGLLPHDHGHHLGAENLGPNINAAWLAGGSILIKEWLYRATLKVAKERKSSVLASNAYHHRVDSLTAFVALLLIAGSNVLNNATWLDPVGGLIISLMVVQAGVGNTKDALLELADVGIDDEMKNNVRRAATKALDSINTGSAKEAVELRSVQGIKSGQNYLMDLELATPGSWSIDQTRGVEDLVRERVGAKVRGVKRVRVRFISKSSEHTDYLDEFIPGDVSAKSSPEPEEEEHEHSHGHKGTNGDARKRK